MGGFEQIMGKKAAADCSSIDSEATGLLRAGRKRSSWWPWMALRCGNTRKCISSKAALLILLWNFVMGLWSWILLNPNWWVNIASLITVHNLAVIPYGVVALANCFFPFAGFLADVKYGRHKTVFVSLCLTVLSVPLLLVVTGLLGTAIFTNLDIIASIVGVAILSVIGVILVFVLYIGLIGFMANAIQFGMDQLHDSPGEDRTLFIYWYVWTNFASLSLVQLTVDLAYQFPYNVSLDKYYNFIGYSLLALIPLVVIAVLIATLCLARHKRRWFLIEPGQYNPYRLVYRVSKFAYHHETPVHRSAFTYCEDEAPRGLDLGKEKYGGPFTIEQVEDVKAFYGILKVSLIFGAVFFLYFATLFSLPSYQHQPNTTDLAFNETLLERIVINNGLLYPLLGVVCIPLYLCLLHPFVSHFVPGILKRMGIGMAMIILSLILSLCMAYITKGYNSTFCKFQNAEARSGPSFRFNSAILVAQLVLLALADMLVSTSILEFICSQSPHSMKGLLIGLLYAIKGLYEALAATITMPFAAVNKKHPHCGTYYYLTNVAVGVVAMLVYAWVAKRYRYRVRDEPCKVHQYAEEYYSNLQRRRNMTTINTA